MTLDLISTTEAAEQLGTNLQERACQCVSGWSSRNPISVRADDAMQRNARRSGTPPGGECEGFSARLRDMGATKPGHYSTIKKLYLVP